MMKGTPLQLSLAVIWPVLLQFCEKLPPRKRIISLAVIVGDRAGAAAVADRGAGRDGEGDGERLIALGTVSPMTGTLIVLLVSPGAKLTWPLSAR